MSGSIQEESEEEHTPLLPQHVDSQGGERLPSHNRSQGAGNNTESESNQVIRRIFNIFFYICCFLSGQYMCGKVQNSTNESTIWSNFILVAGFMIFVGQSCACLAHITLNVLMEICRTQNVSYCTLSYLENGRINCTLSSLTHEYWKFVAAIMTSTFAASVSYILMTVLILIPVYGCCRRCCTTLEKYGESFCPFHDGDHSSIALTSKQARYFYINYVLGLLLLVLCSLASLSYGSLVAEEKPCQAVAISLTSLVLYLISQFCSIQSIFLFSRIVYIITGRLTQLTERLNEVNVAKETLLTQELKAYMQFKDTNDDIKNLLEIDENMGRYYLLQNIDQEFIKQVKPILRLFGVWFIAHWILNALTTVLLSAVILELVINPLQYKSIDHVVPVEDGGRKVLYILFMVFFMLGHTYQFIYPCFRAASITSVREKLIHDVSKKYWCYIPISVKDSFINYLRLENFGFKVPIFCAEFSFNFNWAFVSLFIVICGGFLRF